MPNYSKNDYQQIMYYLLFSLLLNFPIIFFRLRVDLRSATYVFFFINNYNQFMLNV